MAILTVPVFCSTAHSTDLTMKKAFTLIELLVVIGIIAILAGVLIASLSGGTESARAARCLTNMKNLANACSAYALSCEHYPLAGSVEKKRPVVGGGSVSFEYEELTGWVSWDSKSASYPAPNSIAESGWFTSTYNTDLDTRLHALKNGSIWRGVSANEDVYVCPVHAKLMRRNNPIWSYVMNEEFGYADNLEIPKGAKYYGRSYNSIKRADRTLLFSELQFLTVNGQTPNVSASAGYENDCTLQYKKYDEVIGVNHPFGKKGLCAPLAFADGHVEKLAIPASYSSDGWRIDCELKDLTELLCKGKDFERSGSTYRELSK